MSNTSLNKSKAAKNDEYYTRLEDIEMELDHYRPYLKGKKVVCNCDSEASMFWTY
jgi:modification methylase ecoRI|nr:MAG TPA: adenine-specific methyltransferase [Caudoviricetes sp.]